MKSFIIVLTFVINVHALIGFDCGGRHLNITAISSLDVGECDLQYKRPNTTEVSIQLLQLSNYNQAEVFQCKVEISRTVFYCGMNSHISAVHNGQAEYIHETGYTTCMRMFNDGTISMGPGVLLTGIKANQTTYRSFTLGGRIENNGYCKGTAQYSDPYGSWPDVIVQASAKITIKSSMNPVHLESGKIKLRSGTTCILADSFCLDTDDGYSYWKPIPTPACGFNQYDVLYEGPANKTTESDSSESPVYSLTTQDVTFALTSRGEQPLCGYNLLRTEHPKLFIMEIKNGATFASRTSIPIHNLDIFAYLNSKFVYVEKHVRSQMTSLYHNVMTQKCELERQVITNALSFAALQPDEFAYRLMKGPGYMAVNTGESVHIVKCIPVEVTLRETTECYSELPITVRNGSFFLTPRSRIISRVGNKRECSNELPTLFRIEQTWLQFTPKPQVLQLPPEQLKPLTKLTWNYAKPAPLAVSGLYADKEIERLRDHIMFPAEKPALLHEIARRITGHDIGSNAVSVYNLLDEEALNKIADNTASRLWKGFVNFGSATAGIMGIFIIIRVIKVVIDTLLHGYALHSVYGCSLHLLGALWSSITHLLLHLSRGPTRKPDKKIEQRPQQPPQPPPLPTAPPAFSRLKDAQIYVINEENLSDTNRPVCSHQKDAQMSTIQEEANENNPVTSLSDNFNAYPYKTLRDRFDDLEQIPSKSSGFVLK